MEMCRCRCRKHPILPPPIVFTKKFTNTKQSTKRRETARLYLIVVLIPVPASHLSITRQKRLSACDYTSDGKLYTFTANRRQKCLKTQINGISVLCLHSGERWRVGMFTSYSSADVLQAICSATASADERSEISTIVPELMVRPQNPLIYPLLIHYI